jgi:hypothetical protein
VDGRVVSSDVVLVRGEIAKIATHHVTKDLIFN